MDDYKNLLLFSINDLTKHNVPNYILLNLLKSTPLKAMDVIPNCKSEIPLSSLYTLDTQIKSSYNSFGRIDLDLYPELKEYLLYLYPDYEVVKPLLNTDAEKSDKSNDILKYSHNKIIYATYDSQNKCYLMKTSKTAPIEDYDTVDGLIRSIKEEEAAVKYVWVNNGDSDNIPPFMDGISWVTPETEEQLEFAVKLFYRID